MMSDEISYQAKRLLDVTLSASLLFVVAPLMAVFAFLVKADSKGPVFYRQIRVGLNERRRARRALATRRQARRPVLPGVNGQRGNDDRRGPNLFGRPFPVIKFRTMVTDAERNGPTWCCPDDPRVTRVGNFLRKTHLDELPQLINVLRGDMSLVGPRPERPEFIATLTQAVPHYERRLIIKPGVTGLAQIRHRSDTDIDDVKKKVRYDFLYLRNAGVLTDLKIIIGTLPTVFGVRANAFRRLRRLRRAAVLHSERAA